jgi:hypothetical protein
MTTLKRYVAAFAFWLLEWSDPTPATVHDPVVEAVRAAFLRVGLPGDKFSPEFDLMRSGKLAAVLKLAADDLGVDAEFSTVADVVRYLKED